MKETIKQRRRRKRRARRRRRRGRGKRKMSETDLILLNILNQLTSTGGHARPPRDPYARGSTVAPMKTAQKLSHEEYKRLSGAGGAQNAIQVQGGAVAGV